MRLLVYIHLLKRLAGLQQWAAERVLLALVFGSTFRTPPFQLDTAPCLSLFPATYAPLSPQLSLPPQSPCSLSLKLLKLQSPLRSFPSTVWVSFPKAPSTHSDTQLVGWSGSLDELFDLWLEEGKIVSSF